MIIFYSLYLYIILGAPGGSMS